MRLLLDTHVWLWVLESPDLIAPATRAAIETADDIAISAASVWELAIKHALGKVAVNGGVARLRSEAAGALRAFEIEIRGDHAVAAALLPGLHKDPFDRMLVAQANLEGFVLVTADEALRGYQVQLMWARRPVER